MLMHVTTMPKPDSIAPATASDASEVERLRAENAILRRRVEQLDRLAHDDVLVPLANRRGLEREIKRAVARLERHAIPATLLFVDVDGMKQINDNHGHATGDAALIRVASCLKSQARVSDFAARIGGDEFCVLLDHCGEERAREIVERMASCIAAERLDLGSTTLTISVTFGLSELKKADTAAQLLDRADREMYRAKAG